MDWKTNNGHYSKSFLHANNLFLERSRHPSSERETLAKKCSCRRSLHHDPWVVAAIGASYHIFACTHYNRTHSAMCVLNSAALLFQAVIALADVE